jgi:hypothetical protein
VTFTDWLLSLHVLSATALVGGLAALWAVVLATRDGTAAMTLARPASAAVAVGMIGTIVFGIWLALDLDAYEIWDGWIIASLVLWVVGGGLGDRAGRAFAAGNRQSAVRLHTVSSAVALLILVLMIWKPGA